MFERGDRNKDGKVSKDEVPAFVWERISKLDRNNDGGVTKDELAQGFKDRVKGDGKSDRKPERRRGRGEEASA